MNDEKWIMNISQLEAFRGSRKGSALWSVVILLNRSQAFEMLELGAEQDLKGDNLKGSCFTFYL